VADEAARQAEEQRKAEEAARRAEEPRTAQEPQRGAGTLREVLKTRKRLVYIGIFALAVTVIAVALNRKSYEPTETVASTQQNATDEAAQRLAQQLAADQAAQRPAQQQAADDALKQQLLQKTLSNIADQRHQMLKNAAGKLAADDTVQRQAVFGTWRSGNFAYTFDPNGSYTYVGVMGGPTMRTQISEKGTYDVSGDALTIQRQDGQITNSQNYRQPLAPETTTFHFRLGNAQSGPDMELIYPDGKSQTFYK
jgi:hypothetical protein